MEYEQFNLIQELREINKDSLELQLKENEIKGIIPYGNSIWDFLELDEVGI